VYGGDVAYLHSDAQNSVVAMSDAAGNWTERRAYKPFGEQSHTEYQGGVTPIAGDAHGYIGERFDVDAGLQYLNARYYDTRLGLFTQADWFDVRMAGVGTNRFAYSGNDPINLMDPSGNSWRETWDAVKDDLSNTFSRDPERRRAARDYHSERREANARGYSNRDFHRNRGGNTMPGYGENSFRGGPEVSSMQMMPVPTVFDDLWNPLGPQAGCTTACFKKPNHSAAGTPYPKFSTTRAYKDGTTGTYAHIKRGHGYRPDFKFKGKNGKGMWRKGTNRNNFKVYARQAWKNGTRVNVDKVNVTTMRIKTNRAVGRDSYGNRTNTYEVVLDRAGSVRTMYPVKR
jgi:RHS repeat-associated protein